jgi:hypothetical protein
MDGFLSICLGNDDFSKFVRTCLREAIFVLRTNADENTDYCRCGLDIFANLYVRKATVINNAS